MEKKKSVGRYISMIHRSFHVYLHQELKTYNIGSGQFHFLMLLYHRDGVNQETLSEKLNIDKATCARAIKKLEENGYVTRKKDEHDKRSYNIFLTKKAKNIKPNIKHILKKWTTQLLKDFTTKEQQQFYTYLQKISKNALTIHQEQ